MAHKENENRGGITSKIDHCTVSVTILDVGKLRQKLQQMWWISYISDFDKKMSFTIERIGYGLITTFAIKILKMHTRP